MKIHLVQRRSWLVAVAVVITNLATMPGRVQADYLWDGFAGDPQHTALSTVASQPLQTIRWQTPVDDVLHNTHGTLFIHYGEPMVTSSNTVIVPVRGANDQFRLEARNGSTGKLIWSASTDYLLPPHGWVPSYAPALTAQNNLYYAGAGGTVYMRTNPDSSSLGTTKQIAFYTPNLSDYTNNKAALDASIKINTPITADKNGDIYFGYQFTGSSPVLGIGSSGIARIDPTGAGTFKPIGSLIGADANKVVTNSAPALSNDGSSVYIAVNSGGYSRGDLLKLNSTSLALQASVKLIDPQSGRRSLLPDDGTASPTVGPNGDVYFGVLENTDTFASKGWTLHFSGDLKTQKPTGLFGWDDTVSIVPRSMVPQYTQAMSTSPYLIMSKYNNYKDFGLDGINKIAILDPFVTGSPDPRTGVVGMKEVLSIAGLTPDGPPSTAVREWCINTAVVDPFTNSVLANSEDGQLYRWYLPTNKFTEVIRLTPGVGEAYTPTLIGQDGSVYAINDAVLFSVGPLVAVPEPSSWLLGLAGLVLGGAFVGRRSRLIKACA
jgi:hypothetical protein